MKNFVVVKIVCLEKHFSISVYLICYESKITKQTLCKHKLLRQYYSPKYNSTKNNQQIYTNWFAFAKRKQSVGTATVIAVDTLISVDTNFDAASVSKKLIKNRLRPQFAQNPVTICPIDTTNHTACLYGSLKHIYSIRF